MQVYKMLAGCRTIMLSRADLFLLFTSFFGGCSRKELAYRKRTGNALFRVASTLLEKFPSDGTNKFRPLPLQEINGASLFLPIF